MNEMFRRFMALSLVPLILVAAATSAGADIQITDIGATWAKTHIESLVVQGIAEPAPDGSFRPNDEIIRAEFARMAHAAFAPAPKREVVLTDVYDHPARRSILALARAGILVDEQGGPFIPDQSLTRAELITALVQLLGLENLTWTTAAPSFTDVDRDHIAFDVVQTAHRLKLLPPYVQGVLQPSLSATRAEAAAAINEALMLDMKGGLVENVHESSRTITLLIGDDRLEMIAHQNIDVFRNGRPGLLGDIRVGDAAKIVYDRFGTAQLMVLSGVEAQKKRGFDLDSAAGGYITPSDLKALIAGDWAHLNQSIKGKLTDELISQGMGPQEATAVVERDWDRLKHFGQSVVVSVIGARLGVSESLAQGILDGDWTTVKQQLVEEEMIERVISEWLLSVSPEA